MLKHRLIVFCGMDGTGKTTLAHKTGDLLKKENISSVVYHAHGYTFSKNSLGFKEDRLKHCHFLLSFLVPFAFLDNLYTYFFKFRIILRKNTLICDRYFYDKVARMLHYGIINTFFAKLYIKLIPKPDLVFFLDSDAKTIRIRKNELTLHELTDYRKIYKFIAKYTPHTTVIHTALPISHSLVKIRQKL